VAPFPDSEVVSVKLFNALGGEVAQLVFRNMNAGTYSAEWNAAGFSSGVYDYRLEAGRFFDVDTSRRQTLSHWRRCSFEHRW